MTDKRAQEIGDQIRKYRLKAGLSQVGLAELAGVQPNTVARLERGKHRASSLTVEKLAKALQITASEIL